MLRRDGRVARRAIGEHRARLALLAVCGVASAARRLPRDVPRELVRRAGRLARRRGRGRLRVTVDTRWRALTGGKGVTREARRRSAFVTAMRALARSFVAARARALARLLAEALLVAVVAGDLPLADVQSVHRHRSRGLPRGGNEVGGRRRSLAPIHDVQTDEPGCEQHRERDERDERVADRLPDRLHGAWHCRQGSSRRGSSALEKPRPCGFPPGPPTRWHPTHRASPRPP